MNRNMANWPIQVNANWPIDMQPGFSDTVSMSRGQFRERMLEALDHSGWSMAELSRRSGVSYDVINKLKRREGASTTPESARALSAALGFSIDDLTDISHVTPLISEVPLVGPISAGGLIDSKQISDLISESIITVAGLPVGRWIALRVDGDSMDRISPPESVILVDTADDTLVPNACYVISDGEGGATYKRYRPNPDRFEPVSVNPIHETIFPNNHPRIIGRVRRSIIEM